MVMHDLQVGFQWVLTTSMMAGVIVTLILLAKWLLRDRLKPRWQYALWFLVMIKLAVPWDPPNMLSIYNLPRISHVIAFKADTIDPNKRFVAELQNMTETQVPRQDLLTEQSSNNLSQSTQVSETTSSFKWSLKTISLFIWLMGILVLMIYTFGMNRRQYNRIMKGKVDRQDPRMVGILERSKKIMSVKRNVTMVQTTEVRSPSLYGIIKPKLLLPVNEIEVMSDEQLQYIFMHELAHLKRKDIVVNWLFYMLLLIHWFNPLLWYAYSRMREDQELACDALVLTYIDSPRSLEYGRTIITLMENLSPTFRTPGSASFTGNKTQLKRRIHMIKSFKKGSYRWSILGLATIVVIGGIALTTARSTNAQTSLAAPISSDSSSSTASPDTNVNKQDPIDSILELAQVGKVKGSEFAAKSSLIDQVKAAWGQPDQENPAGDGIYATYSDRAVTFGYNKGNQIYDVRSYDKDLQLITLSQVKSKMGQATTDNIVQQEEILTYELNEQFQLKFIFTLPEQEQGDAVLDHIAVISNQAATNLMADNNQPSKPTAATTTTNSSASILKQMKDLAAKGEAKGVAGIIVGKSLIDDVHKTWGTPDKASSAGNPYEAYTPGMNKGTIEFAAGHGDVVYEIRVSGSALDAVKDGNVVTYGDILQVLGKPTQTITQGKQQLLIYQTGNYELRVVLPDLSSNQKTKVSSISVYSPKAAAFDK